MVVKVDIVVYHENCSDGMCALWCAYHFNPSIVKVPCKAGSSPDMNRVDFAGKNVFFLDVSPTMEFLWLSKASTIWILDHHKSAMEWYHSRRAELPDNVFSLFDLSRSGCELAWDFFFPGVPRPFFVNYVADRDLWKFELPDSRNINYALDQMGYISDTKLDGMTELYLRAKEDLDACLRELSQQGEVLSRANAIAVQAACASAVLVRLTVPGEQQQTYKVMLGGGDIANYLKSDLGKALADREDEGCDFAAVWSYNTKDHEWSISLRGKEGKSPDLSKIAAAFGGGGHKLSSAMRFADPSFSLDDIFVFA